MRKITYLFALLIMMSCQPKTSETTITTDTTSIVAEPMVGGDLDKHGCKPSAGYTWSVLKNDCIRVFEIGVRLDPQDLSLDKTISAFAVFANNEKEETSDVEIFVPSLLDITLILKPLKDNGAGTWSNGTYTLTQWKGMYTLDRDKKILYQGHR